MANEIIFRYQHSKTCYFFVYDRTGHVWNTSGGTGAFETYNTTNISNYSISTTEQGTASALYEGTFPSAVIPGIYGIDARQQLGGSVAETDPTVANGDYQWNGTVTLPLSDLATSGQVANFAPIRLARGVMIQNFPFKLVGALDHVTALVSGICSGQISRDGGAFTALQSGAFTEIGLGWYQTTLTSGDLLANTAALHFTAVGVSGAVSDPRDFGFILQRTSGQ